ncbi:MAG: F0F1 ATP synthase subunit A [Propionibacteriaceae bacterium]|nr:F0F1 ATP synthase subunit A [Propionibacteriaceae bacterium]
MPGLIGLLIPLEGETDHSAWPPGPESFNSRPLIPELGPDWYWLNNHLAQAVIGAVLVIGLWLWLARGQKVVPGRRQFLGEQIYNLLRNLIARDVIGHDYRRFLPFLVALFSFILVNNLFGQFFLFMFPTFSKIGYAYGLALMSFAMYNYAGISKYGFFTYMRKMTLPEGVPVVLWPLLIPLEFLSNFIVRPFTLALRLFGNMFAGHLVIMIFVVGGGMLLTSGIPFYVAAGSVSFIFSFAIFALEILVAVLQAYIFTVLSAQYISSAIAEEH